MTNVRTTIHDTVCYANTVETGLFHYFKCLEMSLAFNDILYIYRPGSVEPCARQINHSKPPLYCMHVCVFVVYVETKNSNSILATKWEAVSHGSVGMVLSCGKESLGTLCPCVVTEDNEFHNICYLLALFGVTDLLLIPRRPRTSKACAVLWLKWNRWIPWPIWGRKQESAGRPSRGWHILSSSRAPLSPSPPVPVLLYNFTLESGFSKDLNEMGPYFTYRPKHWPFLITKRTETLILKYSDVIRGNLILIKV